MIVDVQNDFCPGGALPVKDGDKIEINIPKRKLDVNLSKEEIDRVQAHQYIYAAAA